MASSPLGGIGSDLEVVGPAFDSNQMAVGSGLRATIFF
jgi:hypothetical protein